MLRNITSIRRPVYRDLKLTSIGEFSIGDQVYERPRYVKNDYDKKHFVQNGHGSGKITKFILNRWFNTIYVQVPDPNMCEYFRKRTATPGFRIFELQYATKNLEEKDVIITNGFPDLSI